MAIVAGLEAAIITMVIMLGLILIGLGITVSVQAYRQGRKGWWVYLLCAFLPLVNLVLVLTWFIYLKQNPRAPDEAFL